MRRRRRGWATTWCSRSWRWTGWRGTPTTPANAGKRRQEELARSEPVPTTIVRATQFHKFAEMVVGWTRQGDVASVAPLLVQPLAVGDVADVLVEVTTGTPPAGTATINLAGPEPQDLVDMARRTLAARGETVRLVPTWRGRFGPAMAGEVLLPGPDTRIAPPPSTPGWSHSPPPPLPADTPEFPGGCRVRPVRAVVGHPRTAPFRSPRRREVRAMRSRSPVTSVAHERRAGYPFCDRS